MDAVIRFHYGIDPATLGDDAWARHYHDYRYARLMELKALENVFKSALSDVLSKIL